MVNTNYPTSGLAGAMIDTPSSAANFALGEIVQGNDGTEWVYVQASGAIGQYDAVQINEDWTATPLTSALAAASDRIGFAQAAFTDDYYGWICLRGSNIKVKTKASAVASAQLWTTASAGVLDDATAADALKVDGAVLAESAGTAATGLAGIEIKAHWPALRET